MKGLFDFAGWTMYNIGCNYGRTQGIAFALNKAFTTAINAAYGLGFQVSSALSAMSQSLASAMNPQLMKAEGAGNRERMLRFAEIESKCAFLMMAAFSVPSLFEMDRLLQLWLGNVPEYAALFCRMVILAALCDMLTWGLGFANQAVGNIRNYTLLVYTTKLMTLPVVVVLLILKFPVYSVAIAYVTLEFVSSIIRVPFIHKTAGLNVQRFCKRVVLKEFYPILILVSVCVLCVSLFECKNRFLLTFSLSITVYLIAVFFWGLCPDEKELLLNYLKRTKRNALKRS